MMRQQYQTLPARGRGAWFLKLMAEGWQRCKKCDLMYKCDGPRCPECRNKFSRRLRYHNIQQVKKAVATLKKNMRVCSRCKATKTYVQRGIACWFRDKNGGYLCLWCKKKMYNLKNKDKLKVYNSRYYHRHQDEIRAKRSIYECQNRAYINERQRLYRKRTNFNEKARAYWHANKDRLNALRRARELERRMQPVLP